MRNQQHFSNRTEAERKGMHCQFRQSGEAMCENDNEPGPGQRHPFKKWVNREMSKFEAAVWMQNR